LGFHYEKGQLSQTAEKVQDLLDTADAFARLKTVGVYLELLGKLSYMASISIYLRPLVGFLLSICPQKYKTDRKLHDTIVLF